MVEHRRSGVAKASHVWLVQRTQAACGLCDEHKPRVLLQRAQAACGLCSEVACGEHKPCVACVAKTSRVWLVWQANRHSVVASLFDHQEWFPPSGNEKNVRPGIHMTLFPNDSPLRKTSSDGIAIVTAGE